MTPYDKFLTKLVLKKYDTNKITIIDKDLNKKKYPLMTKKEASKIIVHKATNIFFSRLNINKEIKKC